MPQIYIKLRQLIWLLLLFSLFSTLLGTRVTYAQTGNPPRPAGFVLDNKYYFNATTDRQEFLSCPAKRVNKTDTCTKEKEYRALAEARSYIPGSSYNYGLLEWGDWVKTEAEAKAQCPALLSKLPKKGQVWGGEKVVASVVCLADYTRFVDVCTSSYSEGACISEAEACAEDDTLCGYIQDHKNWFNQPPIAQNISLTTKQNISGKANLIATDPDGPTPKVFAIVKQSNRGSASISGNVLTFTPQANWFGSTTLTYRTQDNKGEWSEPATVTITVTERRLALADGANPFTYSDATRQGIIKIKGIDESPVSAVAYLEDATGHIISHKEIGKTKINNNLSHFNYGFGNVPSGTYTLKVKAYDSVNHEYLFEYGNVTIFTLKTLDFIYDPVTRNGQVFFEDKGGTLASSAIQLLDTKGKSVYQVTPTCTKNPQNINSCSFNLNGAPEGRYEAKLKLIDNFDSDFSTQHGYLLIDKTPAVITSSLEDGNGLVEYVSDISFNVVDNYDSDVTISSVTFINDETNEAYEVDWEKKGDNVFLKYFPIPASPSNNLNYKIKIKTTDHQLNESELTASFYYKPKLFFNDHLNVPALKQVFQRPDGTHAIKSDPIKLANGSIINGKHDIIVSLGVNAIYPLKINGLLIKAGEQAVIKNYNFSENNGRLNLSVEPTSEEEASTSVSIQIAHSSAPAGTYNIRFWKPNVKLDSPSWSFKQVVDPINMVLKAGENSICAITSNEQVARRADPFLQPYCFIEWKKLPDEVVSSSKMENGVQNIALTGQAVKLGNQKVEYSVYIYSGNSEKVHVADGEYTIDVTSALGAISLEPLIQEQAFIKLVDEVDVKFKQSVGRACSLTTDENQAIRVSSNGIRDSSFTCFFEWKELPPKLEQVEWSSQPNLRGVFSESGTHNIAWKLSVFSQKGVKVLLADQMHQVDVLDPPAPEITLTSKYLLEDGKTLAVPLNENYVGDVTIKGQRTDMDIEVLRNDHVLYNETVKSGFGGHHNTIQRPINEDRDNRLLWKESIFNVKSSYNLMPNLLDEKSYSVHSVPITGAKPFISSPNEFALNTDTLPIHVDILDQYSHRDPYNIDLLGEWETRVIRIPLRGESEPVSNFMGMIDGHAEFDIDISNIDNERTLRFSSEAKLTHNIDGYERIEISPRVLILSLLRGDAIEADITSRTLSGPAPLRGSFKIDLKEREMQSATGDIVWELSKDGGNTWEEYIPDERYKFIYNNEFETGTYHLRANITNRHSGASRYTEVIEIIAYEKPELRIEGPTIRFVGDEVVLTATPGYESISNGEKVFTPIELDGTVIEWSTDNGRTYDQEGDSITLSSDSQQRIMVAARVRTTHAPAEDHYAFNVTKTSVEFKPIRQIRVRITGPSLVEVGKEYEFDAVTSLPYRGMGDNILGYFTLPNGEQVEGKTLTYIPTDDDLAGGRIAISYHAWIEGYEDQGTDASHTLRSSIWKYIWPDFAMHYQANAPYAPALVTMTIRPMQAVGNRLEDVKYDWTLPEPIEMLDDSRDIIRKFNVLEAGDYTVRVVITDARGHEAVVEHPISLEEAIPYQLNLELSPDNAAFREPLTLTVRPRISGGHPRDRFGSLEFTVDDKPVESLSRYAKIDLEKGVYDIGVKMTSQMGIITEESTQVEVFENQLPICTVSERESSTSVRFTADCTDPDGRMRGYDWQLGDRELVSGSKSITVGMHRLEEINQITLVGIDDSGGRSEPVIIPINYQPEAVGED